MLEDYKKAVISDYHYKKEKGLLSLNLSHPSPAKLRKECLLVLNARPHVHDEKIIKDFFNSGVGSIDYSSSIEKFDADKLKPLVNFLRGITEDPEPINIELLSWLIDFNHRPYKFGTVYSTCDNNGEGEESKQPTPDSKEANEKVEQGSPPKPSTSQSYKKSILKKVFPAMIILLLSTGGIYYYWQPARAYVCDRGTAKKYHLSNKCPALKNCKNSFVSTSIAEAEKNGKTLCGFEIPSND